MAAEGAAKFSALAAARDSMAAAGLSPTLPLAALKEIVALLVAIPGGTTTQALKDLLNERSRSSVADLLERCTIIQNTRLDLVPIIVADLGPHCLDTLLRIADICEQINVPSIHHDDIKSKIAEKTKLLQLARGLITTLTPLVTHWPESRGWKLRDLASAHVLVKVVDRAGLALRNNRLADRDPESLALICERIRQLREDKRELAEALDTSAVLPPDVVAEHAAVLRTAGPFSFLSSAYRRARRLYQSISRVRTFAKNEAARNLEKLAGFLKQQAEFEANPSARMIFGGRYRGLVGLSTQ